MPCTSPACAPFGATRTIIEPLEGRMLLSTSALDPTFGVGGKVVTSLSAVNTTAGVVVSGDVNGKTVVAADEGGTFVVLRYLPNGKPDPSFGAAGKAIVGNFGPLHGMVIQPDGKILLGGQDTVPATPEAVVLRLNTNGTTDASFGPGGRRLFSLGVGNSADAIALQSNGKILVGSVGGTQFNATFVVKRLNANGTTDTTFGSGGIGSTNGGENPGLAGMLVQSTGRIVLCGTSAGPGSSSIELARLNVNGTSDTTFNYSGDGSSIERRGGVAIAQQSNGRLVVVGSQDGTPSGFLVERFGPNGVLDHAFGSAGVVFTTFAGSAPALASSLAIQNDGRIDVAGTVNGNFELARYNTNGSLDTSFGIGGRQGVDFGTGRTSAVNSIALQNSGRILVTGAVDTTAGGASAVGTIRVLGDHVVLAAGQSAVTTGVSVAADPRLAGTTIASQTLSFTLGAGATAVHGQIKESVEKETVGGTLDFYYSILVASGSTAGIASLAASNFAGFTTYVDYRTDGLGSIAPVAAARSSDAKAVVFTFQAVPAGSGQVTAGQESLLLLAKTNATHFNTLGKVSLNGAVSVGGYEPIP